MKRKAGICTATLLAASPVWLAAQAKGPQPAGAPTALPALTEEEEAIVKDRELLENLDLLQNFGAIRYLQFLSVAATEREKSAAEASGKDNANKAKKKT